jgi:ABC-type multidrug transport system ATPase subunit
VVAVEPAAVTGSAKAALSIQGLAKRYGRSAVIEGLDLSVAPGEAVALVGPNGAGKSTVLGCVAGTVIADSGTIVIGGHDLAAAPIRARAILRYLAQETPIPAGLTGREILAFFSDVYGDPDGLAGAVAFCALGDAIDHLATTYSVGMRRRLLFAAMLPGAASLYVLDEPFSAVDREGRQRMVERLQEAMAAGAGVLLAAHERDEQGVQRLEARVVELQ